MGVIGSPPKAVDTFPLIFFGVGGCPFCRYLSLSSPLFRGCRFGEGHPLPSHVSESVLLVSSILIVNEPVLVCLPLPPPFAVSEWMPTHSHRAGIWREAPRSLPPAYLEGASEGQG